MAAHIVPFYLALPFLSKQPNPLLYPKKLERPLFASMMRFPALPGITDRNISKQAIADRLCLLGCFNIVGGER